MIEPKKLKSILKQTPSSPGIYKMLDEERKVIYIGKAKDLSKRIKQYFQKNYQHSTRTLKLLEKMVGIEWTVVDSELEAMILENTMIKQLQPKYNIIMKDDKNYVYIKINKNEDFPRIQIVRKVQKDGAKYIGPKSAAHKVIETFKVLKKVFPFRHCGLNIEIIKKNRDDSYEVKIGNTGIKYPCIDYYIKRCAAPCTGQISKDDYAKIVDSVERFFEGKADNIIKDLELQMTTAAKEHRFERATRLRDRIKQITEILEKQKVSDPGQSDKDIINYCIVQQKAYFNIFQIREGKLIGQENFILSAQETSDNSNDQEALNAFLSQYYELATNIPSEVLIPHEIEDKTEMEKFIENEGKHKVKIIIPKIGDKNKLLEMSLNNARIYADRNKPSWRFESELSIKAAMELQKLLKIKNTLKRIECYDISHLSGTDTVGSMVVFENGIPKPQMYRKFHLRTIGKGKIDDYKSMEELLNRRFNKISIEIGLQNYSPRKAIKKDFIAIAKNIKGKIKETEIKSFYLLEKEIKKKKSIAAFGNLAEYSDKIGEIKHLTVDKKERGKKIGYKLLKYLIAKSKAKRIYLQCKNQVKDYYLLFGFEEINKIPNEIKSIKNKSVLVFDKTKHKPDESFTKIPDLVVIDGGKGQLGICAKVFDALKINIYFVSLAKQLEEIFVQGKTDSMILSKNNEALKLLQRARNEAHRFAISYNKNLRKKHFS